MKSAAVAEPAAHAVEHEDVAARCDVTTLITASTATDVEHLARRIHAASARAACAFVQASAAALPVEARALLETCAGLIDAADSAPHEEPKASAAPRALARLSSLFLSRAVG